LDITERIGSWTKDEHDRGQSGRAVVNFHEVERRRLYIVVVVHLSDQEVLDGIHTSVRSDDSH
jgi:hypothetical protein